MILVAHEHRDHLDKQAIGRIAKEDTLLALTAACAERIGHGLVMRNGDAKTFKGLRVEAVPAYNVVHMRSPGQPFHPKGARNGYVITFGDKRAYVAGDTENVPEMARLAKIDIAFLPMNLPYTMRPQDEIEQPGGASIRSPIEAADRSAARRDCERRTGSRHAGGRQTVGTRDRGREGR